jgi:PAS domain S-box-containing protein
VAVHAECRSEDPVARLFELSVDMLGTASAYGYFTRLNPACERTLGWTNEELMAKPFISFVHPDDLDATAERVMRLKEPGSRPASFENRYRTRDGDYRWIEWTTTIDEGVSYFVGQDVTERRAADAERVQASSVMQAVVESVADGLCVIDPQGLLTFINPAGVRLLGYQSSEELLGCSTHATFHYSRPDGTAYPSEECPLSQVRSGHVPVHVDEDTFWRRDGSALPVSYASAPMDLSGGTGSVVVFRDIRAMQAERERMRAQLGDAAWVEEVHQAMAEDRLVLYGQPIIEIATGVTVKHELLLRMLSRTGQVIEPGTFLPAAEKYGLIDDIDRWVITKAAEMAAAGSRVSVNLSAESVGSIEILAHIESEMARTGALPECLTFEVTETAVMKDVPAGRRFADRLVALGCSFSLDDFGTGYGSLTYLRQLPISYLKVDVQFVREMTQSEGDQRLVQAIVHIAQSFGQRTIAEGVEDEETLDLLRDFGVDFAQGYHLGRPGPFPDLSVERLAGEGDGAMGAAPAPMRPRAPAVPVSLPVRAHLEVSSSGEGLEGVV